MSRSSEYCLSYLDQWKLISKEKQEGLEVHLTKTLKYALQKFVSDLCEELCRPMKTQTRMKYKINEIEIISFRAVKIHQKHKIAKAELLTGKSSFLHCSHKKDN